MTISRKHLNDLAHLTALIEVMNDDKLISKSEMSDVIKTKIIQFCCSHTHSFNQYKFDDYVKNENETLKRVITGVRTPIKLISKEEEEELKKNTTTSITI